MKVCIIIRTIEEGEGRPCHARGIRAQKRRQHMLVNDGIATQMESPIA
jgi:hypothetical protein